MTDLPDRHKAVLVYLMVGALVFSLKRGDSWGYSKAFRRGAHM